MYTINKSQINIELFDMEVYNMSVVRYYKVTCKCGHTGSRRTYIPVTFPVVAENGREAAEKARYIPRCKHHHKDCILDVEECSYEEYVAQQKINKENPYLKCKSIQEQRLLDIEHLFVEDPHFHEEVDDSDYEDKNYRYYYLGKTKIKNPKKYMKNYYFNRTELMEAY